MRLDFSAISWRQSKLFGVGVPHWATPPQKKSEKAPSSVSPAPINGGATIKKKRRKSRRIGTIGAPFGTPTNEKRRQADRSLLLRRRRRRRRPSLNHHRRHKKKQMALDDDDDDGRPSARPESLEIACETRPICRHNPTRKRFSTKQKKTR